MKSADALSEFKRFLQARGANVDTLSVADRIDAMTPYDGCAAARLMKS
jgi:hypothetical protein